VKQALLKNPALLTIREQHGFAAAGVVIAKTYPYNPQYFSLLMDASGPANAGINNRVFNEHYIRLDVEIFGQGAHREAAAAAALSRADWEIANQEVIVSVSAIRAFNAVLYRKRKLAVLEETVRLNERAVDQVRRLVESGRLRSADLILARTDVDAARAALGQGQSALGVAWGDLRRALGCLNDTFAVEGSLGLRPPTPEREALMEAALTHRPDVQVRHAAVAEAEARWRFERANRFGNPSIGPAMEYSETRVAFVGAVLAMPFPVLNTRRECGRCKSLLSFRSRRSRMSKPPSFVWAMPAPGPTAMRRKCFPTWRAAVRSWKSYSPRATREWTLSACSKCSADT
jgi:outer membrane protein TolC